MNPDQYKLQQNHTLYPCSGGLFVVYLELTLVVICNYSRIHKPMKTDTVVNKTFLTQNRFLVSFLVSKCDINTCP